MKQTCIYQKGDIVEIGYGQFRGKRGQVINLLQSQDAYVVLVEAKEALYFRDELAIDGADFRLSGEHIA